MRLPNGYGTVIKIKDRPLRKPWKVLITTGWKLEDGKAKQIKKCLGYYATKQDGIAALVDFHQNGLPPDTITMNEVFEKWYEEFLDTWSEKTAKSYRSIWSNAKKIWDKPIADIKVDQLESVMDLTLPSSRQTLKVVFNGIYKYAMRHEYISKDYARLIKSYKAPETQIERVPFSAEEIAVLWADGSEIANSVLVGIYSGWRWIELMNYEVDLPTDCMTGGAKTKAGKGRYVPIHHKIRDIIGKDYRTASYDSYSASFQKLMNKYGMSHNIHDTRHTTATLLYGQDEFLVKLILGHKVNDITKGVYTHTTIEQLRGVIESIKV